MRTAPYFLIYSLFFGQCIAEPQTLSQDVNSVEAVVEAEGISDSKLTSELLELTRIYNDLQKWRDAIVMQANSHTLFEQLQQSFEQERTSPIQITGTKLHIDSDLVIASNAFFLRDSPVLTNATKGERINPGQTLLLLAEQWTPDNYRWAVLWNGTELGFSLTALVKSISSSAGRLPYACVATNTLTTQSRNLVEQACGALKGWHEQVLRGSEVTALSDLKEKFSVALQQVFTFEQLFVPDEAQAAIQAPASAIILTEVKDRALKSINYGISFYEDSLRLGKIEIALQGAIKLEKISTRYQEMREKIEERKQLLEQRRDKGFTNYSLSVVKLSQLSQADLNAGMTEINQYLLTASACEQQVLKNLGTHIQAYRSTQGVATRQWKKDFVGLVDCAP